MIFINMTQLNKIIKTVLTEQTLGQAVREADIAKKIYDAKGLFIDNEKDAVDAIKQIKTAAEFNVVQQELQKLTGGRGIGQFVTGFIGAIEDKVDPTGIESGRRTLPLINSIISHLKKIKADSKSLKYFTDYANTLNVSSMGKIWNLDETMHNVNTAAQLTSLMIPIVGPFVSAGIGLLDAKAYYDEGDKYTAGLVAVLTLLPAGGVFLKLGKGPIKAFAKKIASKSTVWSNTEQEVLTAISKNKNIIKSKLAELTAKGLQAKKLAPAVLKTPAIKKTLDFIVKGGTAGSKLGAEFVKYGLVPALAYDVAYNKATELSDTEIASLAKKLEVDFDQYLEKRYSANISDSVISKTNTITEAPIIDAASEFISGIGPVGGAVAAVAVGSLLFRKRIAKLVKSLKISSILQLNKKLRDKNTLRALGVNADNIDDFYKAASDESKALWTSIEKSVAEGKLTPTQAMEKLTHIPARGTADKIFKRLTKSYNKKVPVDKLGVPLSNASDLSRFVKEIPKPEKPGAGFGKQEAYEKEMLIWGQRSAIAKKLETIQKDPDYLKWLDMHLKNKNATKMLSQVNKERYAKYAAFWALVGGGFLKTYFMLSDLYARDKHREKLAKLPKTPVTFKKAEGQSISIYKYNAAANTMSSGKGLVYKIRSADKLYKVETSRNTAKWTLIQFPGKEYYWVATTELVDGGGYKEKKTEPDVNAGFI